MKTIIHSVHVHASMADVYRALTTAEGLRGSWTTTLEVEAGIGGIIRFTFHGDFHPHMKQTTLTENQEVRWSCIGGH